MPTAAAAGSEGKSELNQFAQRFCQRPVTKTDIVYTTTKFGNQYQAIVKLNCLGGQEYAGALCLNAKEAEKAAAKQALQAHASTIASLPAQESSKKRKSQGPAPSPAEIALKKAKALEQGPEGENPAVTPKTKLNNICMKIAKRYLQKGETVYECRKVAGGFQATVKLACLPGDWATRVWAGHVCQVKQKAEQSAAEIALAQIEADKELQEEAGKPKGTGKGKGEGGKGKGKGKSGFDYWNMFWCPPPWAWGPGPSGPDLPRERLKEEKVTGEVIEWKDTFGWVKPSADIDHPAYRGKVYVNKKDLSGLESLTAAQKVTFYVYEDPSGIGGEEVKAA